MHILCCGIPLLTTIIGLSTTIGLVSNSIVESPLLVGYEKYKTNILILSGIILLTAFIFKIRAKRLECCEGEAKKLCNTSEKINNSMLKISSVLYLLSLIIFVTS